MNIVSLLKMIQDLKTIKSFKKNTLVVSRRVHASSFSACSVYKTRQADLVKHFCSTTTSIMLPAIFM